jgi:hypothetical protein
MKKADYLPMYEVIREKCDLAITYAEDGAYASAARVLREIAELTQQHVERVNKSFEGERKE